METINGLTSLSFYKRHEIFSFRLTRSDLSCLTLNRANKLRRERERE